MKFCFIIFFFSFLFSCTFRQLKDDKPVVKVFDSELCILKYWHLSLPGLPVKIVF